MSYATEDDIVALYGPDALVVADRNGDGIPDHAAIARALELSSGEIDTYVGRRYSLPLAPLSQGSAAHLTQLCVDIAVYRLALSRDTGIAEHRTRYEDALTVLTKIADGRVSLLLLPQPATDGAATNDPVVGPSPIVAGGPPRLFSREQMRDL